MSSWYKVLTTLVNDAEDHFDRLKYRLNLRLGGHEPIMILPYRGFGTREKMYLKGRVLQDKGIPAASENDSLWDNLVNMYKRMESDEIRFARVLARFNGREQVFDADEEGFFEIEMDTGEELPDGKLWQQVELELVSPESQSDEPVRAEGQVLVPPSYAQFGVISDIDDTVLQTNATQLLKMARTVFLGSARTRLPFKGVAAFYRALLHGMVKDRPPSEAAVEAGINPIFYVSSSPWNFYDLLSDFFHLQNIPLGPVMFLRDWGITEDELLPVRHAPFKLESIRTVMDLYTDLPFILIGDSGQEDPEIYTEVVEQYGKRILAVYIRNVTSDLKRPEAVRELAKRVAEAGSTLILADDTVPMAEHAISMSWIAPEALPEIKEEKEADEGPPTAVEKLLGEDEQPEEAPTVKVEGKDSQQTQEAVEQGAIETALEEETEKGKPPTVVVESDEEKPGEG